MGVLIAIGPLVITPAIGMLLTPILGRHGQALRRGHITECVLVVQLVLVAASWILLMSIRDPQENCDPYEDAIPTLLTLYGVSAPLCGLAVAAALATSRDFGPPIVCAILSLVGTYAIVGLFFTAICTYT